MSDVPAGMIEGLKEMLGRERSLLFASVGAAAAAAKKCPDCDITFHEISNERTELLTNVIAYLEGRTNGR